MEIRYMAFKSRIIIFLLCCVFLADQVTAEDKIQAYFSNDSLNGLKFSDAYETHNMGLIYSSKEYYAKLDLGLVTPDMYVYRNEFRDANRSFGELISLEIGVPYNSTDDFWLYAQAKASGNFGINKLQDFAHQLLALQQVNEVNELIRMPADAWFGLGLRKEFKSALMDVHYVKLNLDGFMGTGSSFLDAKLTKEFRRPLLTYDLSVGGRVIAYDKIVSAPPINAKVRSFIPQVGFGISYNTGPYTFFIRDTFSLPSIKSDSNFYGMLGMGTSYSF